MSIQAVGLKAYNEALRNFAKAENKAKNMTAPKEAGRVDDFAEVLGASLEKVNKAQIERSDLIASFASGENQNVHELMISMQKASLAMNMTAAVRNKVMEAYKELSRLQF
ncbi:MAG: flagellar hook-basal body complex protein FliE [Desulfovibrio sp.]|jgi:flagellar hook-basal body complex protein FliE|nr:flagellar hook-basal body complex protein FliE [Desulfovibrio sp.]